MMSIAEQIAQAIRLSPLAETVIPHFNNHANLDANRVNLEGAVNVTVTAGAATHLLVEGSAGVSGNNAPIRVHTGMSRDEVAAVVDRQRGCYRVRLLRYPLSGRAPDACNRQNR